MSRRKLAWLAFALVWIVGLVVYAIRIPPMPAREPIPNPNGYQDFLAAGAMLVDVPVQRGKETPESIGAYVASNQPALERLRIGLARPSVVPPYHPTNAQAHLDEIATTKSLARLLAGEADIARRSQDWDRLVTNSTQGVDFGLRLARGGVMIDQMIANAAENMARVPLEKAIDEIPAVPARKAALALARLDATREPFRSVKLNEEDFVRRHSPWTTRIAWHLFLRRMTQKTFDRTEEKVNGAIFATRNLTLNLAARAYAVEHGQAPPNPETLVPEYLPAVPKNPLTDKPLTRFYSITMPAAAQIPLEGAPARR